MLTVNPAPTTGASCQEGLADSGTAAARVLQSPVSSPGPAPLLRERVCSPVPPSAQHTLLEHPSRRGSDGFCSVLQHCSLQCCMPGPKAALLGWLPKATKSSTPSLLRPLSRATFPAILGPPPSRSLGDPTLVVLQGTSQWCHPPSTPPPPPLLPDKIEVDICGEIQQPKSACVRDRASWETFPRKKNGGSSSSSARKPSTRFCSISNASFYTCLADNKTSFESDSAGRCFFGGAVVAPRQTWAKNFLQTDAW
jgi:hypothetical protein